MNALDRLIKVRQIRHRLALAALGESQARVQHETALAQRVAALVTGLSPASAPAAMVNARCAADAMLAGLADDLARRLDGSTAERDRRATALARARAAVDAALARRAEREP